MCVGASRDRRSGAPVIVYTNTVARKGGGLAYDRNRCYDPTAGRLTQEDPAGLAGGLNLYGYAGADPANNSDPFGLWPWDGAVQTIGLAATLALSNPTVMRIQDGLQKVPKSIEAAVHAIENISDGLGVGASKTEDVIKNLDISIRVGASDASPIWTAASRSAAGAAESGAAAGIARTVGGVIGFLLPSTFGDPEASPQWKKEHEQRPKPKDP